MNGKTPNPDGLQNELIKEAVACDSLRFQHLFNSCLTDGQFINSWKNDSTHSKARKTFGQPISIQADLLAEWMRKTAWWRRWRLLAHNSIAMNCSGHIIRSKVNLRYLDIQVDMMLEFCEYAELMSKILASATKQLEYLMPNLRDLRQKSWCLLSNVVTSRILYVALFWFKFVQSRGWKNLAIVYRHFQLRVTCCYHTVSYGAVAVVLSILPNHLLAK